MKRPYNFDRYPLPDHFPFGVMRDPTPLPPMELQYELQLVGGSRHRRHPKPNKVAPKPI